MRYRRASLPRFVPNSKIGSKKAKTIFAITARLWMGARFDLQPGHSPTAPGLRRVQSPEEVSPAYEDVMRNARTVDYCAELLGSNIRIGIMAYSPAPLMSALMAPFHNAI